MKQNKKTIFIILAFAAMLTSNPLHAQDLHFSQFFNAPLLINPANTGFIPNADYRIGASIREQWASILSQPYKTTSVFGDAQLFRNKIENGWLGVGAVILSDVAGSGSLHSTEIYGSLAYHQMLGNSSLLTGGFNLGWANKHIDPSKLTFQDQFNNAGGFFDNSLPTSAILNTNSVNYFDLQVGLNYAYFPADDVYINTGFSMQHVNQPEETFFSQNTDSNRIPIRYIAFVNALLKVDKRWIINPSAYYTQEANASEAMLGLNANYDLTGDGSKQLILGIYERIGDAMIPMAGFELSHIRFTFSYDVTTSALKEFNNSQGATEFNILKKGYYGNNSNETRQVLCPEF